MNKKEFIDRASAELELTRVETEKILGVVFDTIKASLEAEGVVSWPKFGKFFVVKRNARKARNPKTGGSVDVPAKSVIRFRPSKELKETSAGW